MGSHPGAGVVLPPLRCDGEKIDRSTLGTCIRKALKDAGLHEVAAERKAWYAATRHTFASQWAMAGGTIPELQKILGHASIEQTMEYAKLAPGYFSPGVHGLLGDADTLARATASVVAMSGETASKRSP